MTIEEQVGAIEKELHLARATLLALQSRNAHTDYDEKRFTGLEAALKTLTWCRDNRALIVKVKGEGNG